MLSSKANLDPLLSIHPDPSRHPQTSISSADYQRVSVDMSVVFDTRALPYEVKRIVHFGNVGINRRDLAPVGNTDCVSLKFEDR